MFSMFNKILSIIDNLYHSLYRRLIPKKSYENEITRRFHFVYYFNHSRTWNNTYWLGKNVQKCPLDLWIYQEIIYNLKPDKIIECGTYKGGSAFYLASLCDLINTGKIITIDIVEDEERPQHERIQYLIGSSTSDEILNQVKMEIEEGEKVLVILDSNHTKNHVLNELQIYSSIVSIGSYIIIEDTNLDSILKKRKNKWAGPMEAVNEFLKGNRDFIIDKDKEKLFMTFNPNGYLKKVM